MEVTGEIEEGKTNDEMNEDDLDEEKSVNEDGIDEGSSKKKKESKSTSGLSDEQKKEKNKAEIAMIFAGLKEKYPDLMQKPAANKAASKKKNNMLVDQRGSIQRLVL